MATTSNGDHDGYFKSYVDFDVHRLMIEDRPRTEAYQQAIEKHPDLIKDKVIMDVGAGTGILSLFCWRAGAKVVYAVEASDMADILEDVVKANDAQECIKVIKGNAETVKLPEKVDLIVSEWMGFYLLHESMLNSVILARDHNLKEDGIMFPSHASIWAAASSSSASDFWRDVYGFSMTPVQKAIEEKSVQKPEVLILDKDELLTEPQQILHLDLRWTLVEELQLITSKTFKSVLKNGTFRGLCLWFDCAFEPTNVILDTAPGSQATHWKQTLIGLPEPMEVEEDEVIGWNLNLAPSSTNPRHYQIALEILDPATEEHPTPCDCKMAKCALISALMKQEDDDELS